MPDHGRITVGPRVGSGGFGEVYRAVLVDPRGCEQTVALKLLREELGADPRALSRLRDEARLLGQLHHEAIPKLVDIVHIDGRQALLTEYVEGEDLGRCLASLPPRATLEALAPVADAVDVAWRELRLVHRDIKPSNIRITRIGGVKLLDFGLARTELLSRESHTLTGAILGTPPYLAPERLVRAHSTVAGDVFALGAILYERFAGQRYYGDRNLPMILGLVASRARYEEHLCHRLDAPAFAQAFPADLHPLLRHCLAYDPADRPSPGTLRRELLEVARTAPGPSLEEWCRERSWPGDAFGGPLTGRRITLERPSPLRVPSSTGEVRASSSIRHRVTGPSRWRVAFVAAVGLTAGTSLFLGGLTVGVGASVYTVRSPLSEDRSSRPSSSRSSDAHRRTPNAPAEVPHGAAVTAPDIARPEVAIVPPQPSPAPSVVPPSAGSLVAPPHPRASARPVVPPRPPPEAIAPEHPYVTAEGALVFAVSDGEKIRLPAHLPPGTYVLEASFHGAPPVVAGTLRVAPGARLTLRCSSRMRRCTAP